MKGLREGCLLCVPGTKGKTPITPSRKADISRATDKGGSRR
jgi:hypothetical protein